MRKKLINSDPMRLHSQEEWHDLEEIATVEVTSEDPNIPIEAALAEEKDRAGERPKRVSRSSASSLITRQRCVGLDWSFPKQKLSEPRNSRCDGLKQVGHSEKSFVSNGTSVRKAQPARSKIIRSG